MAKNNKELNMKILKYGGLFTALAFSATSHSSSHDSRWIDFTGTDQISSLVSAQDDRGEGKASAICQYYHGEDTDYSAFHGLGYLKQKSNGSYGCYGSVETNKIYWHNNNPWGTSHFRVLPKTALSGTEQRWTEFREDDFGRYIEATFEDGINAPVCSVQHKIDEYQNYENFHGLGYVKWDTSKRSYRCVGSFEDKMIWQPNGNAMQFSRFNVLKAEEPEVLTSVPNDTSRRWTYRSLGKPNSQGFTISNSADYEPGQGSFSVGLWFYVDNLSGIKKIARKGNADSQGTGWSLFMNGNKIYFRTRSPGFNSDQVAHISNPGWHHFVGVVDADKDRLFAYLDGSPTLVDEGEWSGRIPANSNITSSQSLKLTESFAGNIATDLRLYKRALSWQEAKTLAQVHKLPGNSIRVEEIANGTFQIAERSNQSHDLLQWQMGDGLESFLADRQYTYGDGGKYKLTLTLIDNSDKLYQQHISLTPSLSQSADFVNSAIFRQNDLGYACFRIPAIVNDTSDGSLLAFAEARTESCADHHHKIDIVMKRSFDNGRSWEDFTILAENGNFEVQNVAPVYDAIADRTVILYNYQAGNSTTEKAARLHMMRMTDDGGDSWTPMKDITNQVTHRRSSWLYYTDDAGNKLYDAPYAWGSSTATLGHAIQLENGPHPGRLMFISYYSYGGGNNYSIYSDDHGESYSFSEGMPTYVDGPGSNVVAGNKLNEATGVELANGWILASARDSQNDTSAPGPYRHHTLSRDGGSTWGETIKEKQLEDPKVLEGYFNGIAGIASGLLRVSEQGKQDINRLIYSAPAAGWQRDQLQLKMSYDEGNTWPIAKTLAWGGAAYSDLVLQDDRRVGLVYEIPEQYFGISTDTMDEIRYVNFTMDWLTDNNEDTVSTNLVSVPNDQDYQFLDTITDFNGSNGISLGHNPDWNPDEDSFTVSYRFMATQTNSSWHHHVNKSSRDDVNGRGWMIFHGGGNINFRIRGDNGNEGTTISAPLNTVDKWHHVAASINRTTNEIRLYVDGRMAKASIAHQGNSISSGNEDLHIARHQDDNGHQFIGKMKDVRIYNRGLSSKAVRALTGNMDDQVWIH